MSTSGVKCSQVKCSENLSNRMSDIIRRYTQQINFSAFMALSFIVFFHVLLAPFLSLYIRLCVLYTFVSIFKLCIIIVIFMYYRYVCTAVYILCSLCQLALFGYPALVFSRVFTSVVRQMPRYNCQRRARPAFFQIIKWCYSVYCFL